MSDTLQKNLDFFNTVTNTDNVQGANSIPQLNMKATGTAQFLVDVTDKNGNVITGSTPAIPVLAFSGTTAQINWTAGAFRRLEVYLTIDTGATTSVFLGLVGLTAGTYYTSGNIIATLADKTVSAQDGFRFDGSVANPVALNAQLSISKGGNGRTITAMGVGNTGQGEILTGLCLDTTHDATGVLITFSTACTGHLEIVGHA